MIEYKQLINDIYEKDGTLYLKEGDEYTSIEVNLDCYSANEILSRENVREMSYEVDTNSEISHVSLPSSKLEFELETNIGHGIDEEEIQVILDYFSEELEAADKAALEELVPMEGEAILEHFSEFLDWPEIAIFKGWTDEDRIVAFMNELNYGFYRQKWPKPSFHSDNEVREICRKWLTERSIQWRLGSERGFYYQPELK